MWIEVRFGELFLICRRERRKERKKKKKKITPNNKEPVGFADPLIFKLILPHVVHLLTLAVRCEQEVCEKPGGDRTSGSENGSRETGSYVSSVGAGEVRYE